MHIVYRVLASRIQIPLILAWAISIHKAQGMTIPLLEVSFNRIFEYGQAYVALSRATSLEGLTLRSFQAHAVRVHPTVDAFYQLLHEIKARQRQSQGEATEEDKCLMISLKQLIESFQKENTHNTTVDNEKWVETRPLSASRNTATSQASNSKASEENEVDDWLERPRSNIPINRPNSFSSASNMMSSGEKKPFKSPELHTNQPKARIPIGSSQYPASTGPFLLSSQSSSSNRPTQPAATIPSTTSTVVISQYKPSKKMEYVDLSLDDDSRDGISLGETTTSTTSASILTPPNTLSSSNNSHVYSTSDMNLSKNEDQSASLQYATKNPYNLGNQTNQSSIDNLELSDALKR